MLYLYPMQDYYIYTEKDLISWVLRVKDKYLCPYMVRMGQEVIKMGWIRPYLDSICDRIYQIDHKCYFGLKEGDFSGTYGGDTNELYINPVHMEKEGSIDILKTHLHEIAHLFQFREGIIPEYVSKVKDVLAFERPAEVWAWWVYFSLLEQGGVHDTELHCLPSYFNSWDIEWTKKRYGWT